MQSKEKRRLYNKKYREDNKDKIIALSKKYRENNKEKIALSTKKWKDENKKKASDSRKKYYKDNREIELPRSKKYNETHRNKVKANWVEYFKKNKDKINKRSRKYYKENSDKMKLFQHNRRAIKLGVGSEKFFDIEIFERDGYICGICGKKINKKLKHPNSKSVSLDHIVPLSKGGSHTRNNTQAAHLVCNLSKSAKEGGQLLLEMF